MELEHCVSLLVCLVLGLATAADTVNIRYRDPNYGKTPYPENPKYRTFWITGPGSVMST